VDDSVKATFGVIGADRHGLALEARVIIHEDKVQTSLGRLVIPTSATLFFGNTAMFLRGPHAFSSQLLAVHVEVGFQEENSSKFVGQGTTRSFQEHDVDADIPSRVVGASAVDDASA
jgi:hypothetical protein